MQKPGQAPNRIKELRIIRGWSQDRLARRARVNWSTISYLERGERNASDLVKQKIAKAFGVAVEDVFPVQREAATA
jgi:putative transcriptional regulator